MVLLDTLVHELNTVRGLLGEPTRLERALPELDAILDVFDAVRSYLPGPPPRPTLADNGSQARRNRPGRSVKDHSLGFDADAWRRFAAGLAMVIGRCRDRGYEPTFHPETGTHVEAPWEIERVLDVSDVGLCLETGHMLLGGGDPVAMLRDLGDRVNHVHLKDARLPVMAEIVADEAPVTEIWTREAFCALGRGDLDADAILDGLRRISFGGWLVVEQDILPRSAERFARAAAEQRHNREFLAARGLRRKARAVIMGPFGLGLIGAGRMGRTHLRALAGSDVVKVTAVAEMAPAARQAVAAPGVTAHATVAEMLDSATLDGVLIAAPTDQHGAIIAEVAARGLPILCEKPCGLTAAAARASAQAAAAAGVPLQVAYWRRFVPGLRQLHDRIAAGELGVIHLITCYQWDERPPSPVFRAHSGGIAIDMGVHEFDQLRWLTGQDIAGLATVSSGAVSSGSAPDGIADVDGAQVVLTLTGGATGFVSLGRYFRLGDAVWAEAFGTQGHERCDVIDPAEGEVAQLAALRAQAESFAAFAVGNGPCEGATAADAIAALTAAEQVTAALPVTRENVSAGLPPSYRHRPGG